MIGTSLNQYRITASIGAGGMGEVFRARDTRLNRDVAVKVLPKDFVADANRLRRFEQEAKTLAALNHPNVLTVFDAGVHEGAPYLVSELLEGKTLREEMNGAALPVLKATEYALQLANGLAAAHGKGIIHRDLKPANIFVTKDGRVKILDFGLAKLRSADAHIRAKGTSGGELADVGIRAPDAEDSTVVQSAVESTEPGMVLGTPAYMSPEQVRGELADHRADIFAFGCVLYEMLSGTRAFRRSTPIESMNAVLSEEPLELSGFNANVPPALERIVRRCLEKQPDNRFQTAKDLTFAIENMGAISTTATQRFASAAAVEDTRFRVQRVLPWAVTALAVIVALYVVFSGHRSSFTSLGRTTRGATSEGGVLRKFDFQIPLPTTTSDDVPAVVLSPDGQKLAYRTADGIGVRWLDRLGPPTLLVAGENLSQPFWSPQSTEVAYFEGRKLNRISLGGGRPILICFAPEKGGNGAWFPDDRIIFTTGWSGLHQAFANGGEASSVVQTAKGEQDFHDASLLPGGRGVLFVVHRDVGIDTIAVWERNGSRKTVLQIPYADIWRPVYSPPNHVLFERNDWNRGLWAVPFSLTELKATGEPFRVVDEGSRASVANDGTIAYSKSASTFWDAHQLVWVDRTGHVSGRIGSPQVGLHNPELSPDGRNIVATAGPTISAFGIWIFDIERGNPTLLTRNNVSEWYPHWFPNGRRVLFARVTKTGARVVAKSIDGIGAEDEIGEGWGAHLAKSGKYLLLGKGARAWSYLPLPGAVNKPVPFPGDLKNVNYPALSPDDSLLAYWSNESGRDETYVVAFPAFTGKVRISNSGGRMPLWRPDGSELFYQSLDGRSIMSVNVRKGESSQFGEATKLFDLPELVELRNGFNNTIDVSTDGQRFLMVQRVKAESGAQTPSSPSVIVVENWFEEFRGKK